MIDDQDKADPFLNGALPSKMLKLTYHFRSQDLSRTIWSEKMRKTSAWTK